MDRISTKTQPDRQTMDLATQTHLTELRDLLTCRLLELQAEVTPLSRLSEN